MAVGYWGRPTASVDWCENNYAVTYYVAEFWNTISSLVMVVIGIYGIVTAVQKNHEKRFLFCHLGLSVVGIGSALFHGTLTYYGQALDELPMIWLSLVYLYVILSKDSLSYEQSKSRQQLLIWGLLGYASIITVTYLIVEDYFFIMLVSFISASLFVIYLSVKTLRSQHCDKCDTDTERPCSPVAKPCNSQTSMKLQKRAVSFGVLSICIAFAFWNLNNLTCQWLEPLQFHALWHVFAGLAGNLLSVSLVLDRSRKCMKRACIDQSYTLPVVHIYNVSPFKSELELSNSKEQNTSKKVFSLVENPQYMIEMCKKSILNVYYIARD